MNKNSSVKFLCHKDVDNLSPINSKFSGIFNKSLFVNDNTEEKVNIPKQHSGESKKELNLSDYFKSLQLLQNINEKQLKILKKISSVVPQNENGFLTMKTSSKNQLENVVYYNHVSSKLINYNIIEPSQLGLDEKKESMQNIDLVPPKRKVGRPRNEDKKILQTYSYDQFHANPLNQEILIHKTKYGRSIKFNTEVAKMLQIDQESQLLHKKGPEKLIEGIKRIPTEPLEEVDRPRKQRIISSEFRCATCKKVYLGKNKMNHHLKLNPSHRVFSLESDLFSHLMKLVRQKKNNQDMANVFFKELSSFVQQCEKLTPKLITNNENHPNVHHHVIDKNSASVLRINPGEYKINMNVFDKNFKFDNPLDQVEIEEERNVSIEEVHHQDIEHVAHANEVIKVLDDVPSLDGNEVNLLIPQTNELTHLTNISDIITNSEHEGDNALLGFLN
ncbi:uncharacterized protein [Chironomus tepperi]|uniref:uncharacterized protein n=1 Tax=Chironomus tepperi TaxID=113505 RepID=UPI00391F0AEF